MTAATALRRAIYVKLKNFAGVVVVEEMASQSWASITFTGERHEMRLRLEGDRAEAAADTFLDGLRDREFDLSGHILIDIAGEKVATPGGALLALEAVTVEAD